MDAGQQAHHHEDSLHKPAGMVMVLAGPAAALLVWAALQGVAPDMPEPARRVCALTAWMAVWWLAEVLPLGITALLPLIALPMMGVLSAKDAAANYADRVIFLFMGGFLLALGMEKWNLHRRIALVVMSLFGTGPRRLVLGMMAATALISMWVSNTATALMMLPIALGIIELVEKRLNRPAGHFAVALILGVGYAASIGGVATPIGSPPNAVLTSYLDKVFHHSIGFRAWMTVGVPFVALFIPLAWLYLVHVACPVRLKDVPGGRELIRDELVKLGPVSRAQWGVMGAFALTVGGWVLREPVSDLLNARGLAAAAEFIRSGLDDTAVAMIGGLLLFIIPSGQGPRHYLMDWATARRIPWDILLLFGGGLCLAAGIQSSGLDKVIGAELSLLKGLPIWLVVLTVSLVSVFFSEFTSNVAQANVFYPIVGAMAVGSGLDPLLVLFPCCMALSNAFMMPMGTPPNAIAFSTGRVSIRCMALTGLGLNLIGIAVLMLLTFVLTPRALGLKLDGLPDWARPAVPPSGQQAK